ncbi:MAG: hypothetical protein QOI29_9 [Mycobacterium sp.]|nr:hypothetical protein [Mycobacterium sp.]
MASPASPPIRRPRSSTTRCHCWRRSPPPTTSSTCGSSRDRNRKQKHGLSGNRTHRRRPGAGPFMTAMRRLQDIVVSTNPDDTLWADAAGQIEELCARLEVHRAPQGVAPAGRGPHLPGLGHPLMPPWMMTEAGPDGVPPRVGPTAAPPTCMWTTARSRPSTNHFSPTDGSIRSTVGRRSSRR